jgi:hypothetical protein
MFIIWKYYVFRKPGTQEDSFIWYDMEKEI